MTFNILHPLILPNMVIYFPGMSRSSLHLATVMSINWSPSDIYPITLQGILALPLPWLSALPLRINNSVSTLWSMTLRWRPPFTFRHLRMRMMDNDQMPNKVIFVPHSSAAVLPQLAKKDTSMGWCSLSRCHHEVVCHYLSAMPCGHVIVGCRRRYYEYLQALVYWRSPFFHSADRFCPSRLVQQKSSMVLEFQCGQW